MRAIALVLGLLLTSACTQTMVIDGEMVSGGRTKASIVLEVLQKGLCEGDEATINKYVAEDYRQHNPMAEDGRAGLLAFVRLLKGVTVKIKVARVLTDGDFVAVHSDVWFGDSHSAVFDLFIVRDGMLREHWDCIQAVPQKMSVTSGPTEITDRDKTEANRKLVTKLYETVFVGGQWEELKEYADDKFVQHGPHEGNGLRGLPDAYILTRKRVHRVIAEGNFVLAQTQGDWEGKNSAFYDLFRVEEGKIVEHWDTIQEVPARSKNKNGMF